MFDDRDGMKRIVIAAVAAVLVVVSFCWMMVTISNYRETTKQDRIGACQLIQDEQVRDDCLNGGWSVDLGGGEHQHQNNGG